MACLPCYFELVLEFLDFYPITVDVIYLELLEISYFILKMYVVRTRKNCLDEAILMSIPSILLF